MRKENISDAVIRRLPRYYRQLTDLCNRGVVRISSHSLGQEMNITASQIRQDLSCFGEFGQQGYGYNVKELHAAIAEILGINAGNKTILIGAGNLGSAIASHIDFNKKGFRLIGIFDSNPEKNGQIIAKNTVMNIVELEKFCKKNNPVCAVLCIPKSAAEEIVTRLINAGIKGFWNFSHYDLTVHKGIIVENVHLTDSLMTLAYGLNHADDE